MGNMNDSYLTYGGKQKSGLNFDQNFEEIKKNCLRAGRLFEDNVFPATYDSLFLEPNRIQGQNLAVKWLRPHVRNAYFFINLT